MSQVKFSGSCSQDSGSQCRKSQVTGTQFPGPGCQSSSSTVLGFRVPYLRVPESQGSGSQSLRVPVSLGLESQGPKILSLRPKGRMSQVSGSRVSGPDFRLCRVSMLGD